MLRECRKKMLHFKFILLLFLAYYEKLKQKKIRDEKVGRPVIIEYLWQGENHNLIA